MTRALASARVAVGALLGSLAIESALRALDFAYPRAPGVPAQLVPAGARIQPDADTLWAAPSTSRGSSIEAMLAQGLPIQLDAEPVGTLRFAVLGDETSFGPVAPDAPTYAGRTLALLAKQGRLAECTGAAVPGFTAVQGLARYRSRLRDLELDAVVIAFNGWNDWQPALGAADRELLARARPPLRALELACWVADCAAGARWPALARELRGAAPDAAQRNAAREHDWSGLRRASPAEFERALRALIADVISAGARPILLSIPAHPDVERRVSALQLYARVLPRIAAETGATWLDLGPRFAQGDAAQDFGPGLALSERGHALVARELAACLREIERARDPEQGH